ncbi:MAG: hypothetical protein PHI63_03750 [Patescibacteria group bacterium]|nr:hypothetical protein [Patescibacteria group bacterium]
MSGTLTVCASVVGLLKAIGYGGSRFFTNYPIGGEADWGFFDSIEDIDSAVVKDAKYRHRRILLRVDDAAPKGHSHPYAGMNGVGYTCLYARWRPKLRLFQILVLVKEPGKPPVRKWYEVNALYHKLV